MRVNCWKKKKKRLTCCALNQQRNEGLWSSRLPPRWMTAARGGRWGDFDLLLGGGGGPPSPNDTEQIRQGRLESAHHLGRRHTHSSSSQFPARRDPPSLRFPAEPQPPPPPSSLRQAAVLFTSGATAALQCLGNRPQVDSETNRREMRMDSVAPHWDLITGATVGRVLLCSVLCSATNAAPGP